MRTTPLRTWHYQNPDIDLSFTLAAGLKISPLVARLLVNRGINSVEEGRTYLHPTYADLHSPFAMADMDKAVERIRRAIKNSEPICVYGDYDADGTTATALLVNAFKHIDYPIKYYIPDRFEEGYGLNDKAIRKVKENGCSLMITVDCGISSVEEVKTANELGMDVILTDHHQPPLQDPPPAYAIISPKVKGNEYPYTELAGVGLAFKLTQGLIDDESYLTSLLDLVALGTVVDLAPLTGENRTLSRLGLEVINKQERIGVEKLCQVAGIQDKMLDGGSLSFHLGPRLNAAGRMDTALKVVELLTTDSSSTAEQRAAELNKCNELRKEIEHNIQEKAIAILSKDKEFDQKKGIVVASDTWGKQSKGVVGIVASRLLEQFYRPVFVLTIEGNKASGSGRCIDGMNLADCLNACSSLLLKHGGHKAAAGVTLTTENIPKFKKAFNEYATDNLDDKDLIPKLKLDFETNLSSVSLETLEELQVLEPFGLENPQPSFVSKDISVQGEPRLMGKEMQHLSMYVTDGIIQKKTIGWRKALHFTTFKRPNITLDLAFRPEINEYNGLRSVQLILEEFLVNERTLNIPVYPPEDTISSGRVFDHRNQSKKTFLSSLLNQKNPCIIYVLNDEKMQQLQTAILPDQSESLGIHDETTAEMEEIELLENMKDGKLLGIVSSGIFSKSALERVPIVENVVFCHLTSENRTFFDRCIPAALTQKTTAIHLLYNEESDVQLLNEWLEHIYPDRNRLRILFNRLRDLINTDVTQLQNLSHQLNDKPSIKINTSLSIFEELELIEITTREDTGKQFVRLLPHQTVKLANSRTFLRCQWMKQNSHEFQKFQLQENTQKIWERIKDECRISDPED